MIAATSIELKKKKGRLSNHYLSKKLPELSECMGGCVYHEGKLFAVPQASRSDIELLSTSRASRLIYDEDDLVEGLRNCLL